MILDEIGAFLEAEGVGIIGQTLFLGSMPQDEPGTGSQDAVMAVIEIPGQTRVAMHDLAKYERPYLQIATRGAPYGYPAARLKAQEAWDALDGVANTALSGATYLLIEALQSPYFLRTDDLNRPYLIFNCRCARAL
jgi:hypothetical protein